MKTQTEIRTKDNYQISLTTWSPKEVIRGVIVIGTSIDVTQATYEDFADWLCKKGFQVFTFDYRGIGRSRPK